MVHWNRSVAQREYGSKRRRHMHMPETALLREQTGQFSMQFGGIRSDSGLPPSYWAEIIAAVIYVLNLMPSRRHPGQNPSGGDGLASGKMYPIYAQSAQRRMRRFQGDKSVQA